MLVDQATRLPCNPSGSAAVAGIERWPILEAEIADALTIASDAARRAATCTEAQRPENGLHYVFDLCALRWRQRVARVIIIRYADDILIGFQHPGDAKCFRRHARPGGATADCSTLPHVLPVPRQCNVLLARYLALRIVE